jgi:general secretion pathway protein K
MLIAALVAAVAATLLWQQQWNLRHHQARREQVQAQALVVAGLQWARQILRDDARGGSVDHLGEVWALRLPATPVEDGEISGFIVDQQGLFNVNNIVRGGRAVEARVEVLRRLLETAGLPAATADAIVDWLDADSVASGEGGAEDADYAKREPPALAANRPLLRVAELASVKGLGVGVLAALHARLAALPEETPLNVNTATAEVLQATLPGLDATRVQQLLRDRAARPFTSVAEFRSRIANTGIPVDEEALSVSSRYFTVTVEARQGETRARGRALLRRDVQGLGAVVWQVVE